MEPSTERFLCAHFLLQMMLMALRGLREACSCCLLIFPSWAGDGTNLGYSAYLRESFEVHFKALWLAAVRKHVLPIPYARLVLCIPSPLQRHLFSSLPWEVLLQQRMLVRLRGGLVPLGHKKGQKTKASVQACIGCGCESSQLWAHIFGSCVKWQPMRNDAMAQLRLDPGTRPWDIMLNILSCPSTSHAYGACLEMVARIVCDAECYWRATHD